MNGNSNVSQALLFDSAKGMLGLAPQASNYAATNQFVYSHAMDRIDNFSIYLSSGDDPKLNNSTSKSRLLLNRIDDQLIRNNNLTRHFAPLAGNSQRWAVTLKYLLMDHQRVQRHRTIVFDPSVTFLALPFTTYFELKERFWPKCREQNFHQRVLLCPTDTHLQTLGFTLGSDSAGWTTFHVCPNEYSQRIATPAHGDQIAGHIAMDSVNNEDLALGIKFLEQYYAMFEASKPSVPKP